MSAGSPSACVISRAANALLMMFPWQTTRMFAADLTVVISDAGFRRTSSICRRSRACSIFRRTWATHLRVRDETAQKTPVPAAFAALPS
jgi:hypothetical protein